MNKNWRDFIMDVLVEAKREYMAQLCAIMCPLMIETFENLYIESNKLCKGKESLKHYQKMLKEVKHWNNSMINEHSSKFNNSCVWFNDLLAAIFVSYVKILSSVRITTETRKISVKMPNNELFVHKCYENVAKNLYDSPHVFHDVMSEMERDEILTRRFILCIEKTVKDMIPVQDILKAYISQRDESVDISGEPPEDDEDPDLEDGVEPVDAEPPPVTAEGEAPAPPEPVSSPLDPVAPIAPVTSEDIKNVQLTGKAIPEESESLFDDAPDS
jgi:hypothetical protein